MPSRIFKVIKANGGSSNYQIKRIAFIFYSSAHWSYMYCYVAMCPAGLQGAKFTNKSRTQMLALVCRTLFNITDITTSQTESHLKATRRFLGELLKVSTANWRAFHLKYKVFDKHKSSTRK